MGSLQEGLGSLWNGTKASLMLVSNPAIKFTVYELLKRHYARVTGRQVLIIYKYQIVILIFPTIRVRYIIMNIVPGEGRAVGLLAGLPRHRRGHRGHLSSAAHTGHTTDITELQSLDYISGWEIGVIYIYII